MPKTIIIVAYFTFFLLFFPFQKTNRSTILQECQKKGLLKKEECSTLVFDENKSNKWNKSKNREDYNSSNLTRVRKCFCFFPFVSFTRRKQKDSSITFFWIKSGWHILSLFLITKQHKERGKNNFLICFSFLSFCFSFFIFNNYHFEKNKIKYKLIEKIKLKNNKWKW